MIDKSGEVSVWDPLVRIFHWTLALSFMIAWVSEDDFETIHIWAGYTVAALISFRVVWGIIGTRYARFTDFIYRWKTIKTYLKSLLLFKPDHYIGHNPAGGAMVILLLLSLAALTFTGMAIVGMEGMGPLAASGAASLLGRWTEDIHEVLANLTMGLIIIHVAGVLVSSLLHRENLVSAMINGKKKIK